MTPEQYAAGAALFNHVVQSLVYDLEKLTAAEIERALAFILEHVVSGQCRQKDQHAPEIKKLHRALEKLTNQENQT